MPTESSPHTLPPRPKGLVPFAATPLSPYPPALPVKTVCRIVSQLTAEAIRLIGGRTLLRRELRRQTCHVRQIAMYVCHVALRIPQADIGAALGRDRTTVSHACNVVEDRRDDAAFDEFVSAIERLATIVFSPEEFAIHD